MSMLGGTTIALTSGRSLGRYFGGHLRGDAFDTFRKSFMKSLRLGTGISAPCFVRCFVLSSRLPLFMR